MSAITTPSLQNDQLGSAESHEDRLSAILDRDNATKRELLEIYDDVKKFLLTDPDDILDEEIEAHYKNHKVTLDNFPEDLMGSERPIIFTGETSAGKSSLLNLFLGFDILPTGTLPSTGVICRLRTSTEKKAEIFYQSDSKCDTVSMENGDEEAFKKILNNIISPEENRENHNIQYVDLYWPIPFLRKNIIVVDTPGIGESAEMTSRLKEYLLHAVALVYVLDISRGGGIQRDRIVPLLKIFNNEKNDDGFKSKFDPACAIFIANKWDMVEDHEEKRVKTFIKRELTKYWPHLQERQIYCLSTKKALKNKKKGKPLPDSYLQLRHGLEQLVEVRSGAKSRQHKIWLQKFLSNILKSLQSHIQISRMIDYHQERRLKEGDELLTMLQDICVNDKLSLEKEKETECRKLIKKVYEHLKDERNWDKMFPWDKHTLPNKGFSLQSIREEALLLIKTLVAEEFNSCLHTNGCKEIMNTMIEKVSMKAEAIQKGLCKLEKILQQPDMEDDGDWEGGNEEKLTKKRFDDPTFSNGELAIVAVTFPLWFPLALVGSFMVISAGIAALPLVAVNDTMDAVLYNTNKEMYMQQWSKEYIDELDELMVKTWVEDTVFSTFNKKFHELFDVELSRTVNGFKKLISNLKNEKRSSDAISKHYQPKVAECERIMEKLNTITTDTV